MHCILGDLHPSSAILENFEWPYLRKGSYYPLHVKIHVGFLGHPYYIVHIARSSL